MKIKLFTLPNLLTLSNLMCGVFATVSVLKFGNLTVALWFIVAAAVCDFFDGFVARLLHCSSPIGGELDSLADMVSFGVVPSVVAFAMFSTAELPANMPAWMRTAGSVLCFSVAAFSALRLAKFNIDDTQHTEFEGLPTPACALFFLSLGYLSENATIHFSDTMPLIALAMGLMLISPIRMFALKFKGFGWKGNELRYLFILVSAVLCVFMQVYAVPVIVILYVMISSIRWVYTTMLHPQSK